MDQTLHLLAEDAGVNPTVRQRSLPPALHQLHQHILRHFAERAAPPEPERLQEWAHQLGIDLDAALAHLVTVDLIEAGPTTSRLLGAYPFSAIPRGYTVQLAGGPTVEAYCAIDALGIPAMLGRNVVISSRDPGTGDPIRITVTGGQASWQPDETVVVVVTNRSCGASACGRCPYITFHISTATAQAHLQATDLAGRILTPPRALAAATVLFGDLLGPTAAALPDEPTPVKQVSTW